MKYKEVQGCLITKALAGEFDIIAHGCNCQCTMKSGLAPQMTKTFGCDEFEKEKSCFKGDINKLGTIDFNSQNINVSKTQVQDWRHLIVVNAYTQFMYGAYHPDGVSKPLDYEALTLCMRKINHLFKGKHIGLPLIGCHLAGGVWSIDELSMHDQNTRKDLPVKDVKTIIQEELKDMDVTIVHYKP
jgi:O-acetyl-ADP-ribose deacetylase (regulator of RNase III)